MDDMLEGASNMGGEFGGEGGGEERVHFGGDAFPLINLNSLNNPINYLGVEGCIIRTVGGGTWGQFQGQCQLVQIGSSTPSAPQIQHFNHLTNPWSFYPSWNGYGYSFQNYDQMVSPNLSVAPPPEENGPLGYPTVNAIPGRGENRNEKYSRMVFIGGLPPDIDEGEIVNSFYSFGPLVVDWPGKSQSRGNFPPKGYAFLIFEREISVRRLVEECVRCGDNYEKLTYFVNSPTVMAKPVQVRPWRLADGSFFADFGERSMKGVNYFEEGTVAFVGGVPRPLRAVELARLMDDLFGGVGYAAVNVDWELSYPKGSGRVGFKSVESYEAAVRQTFVRFPWGKTFKLIEVKPFEKMI